MYMNKLDVFINEFINYLLIDKKYSNDTIVSYKNDLDKFCMFFKNKKIDNIKRNRHYKIILMVPVLYYLI